MPQDIESLVEPSNPVDEAFAEARMNALVNQQQGFLNQMRMMHIALLVASTNNELSGEFKIIARGQLLQMATILEDAA